MTTVEIPLSRGYVAIVDAADADLVLAHNWYARPNGRNVYAQRGVRRPDGTRTTQLMHVLLTGFARTDHRDGDGLNNRRSNLREATAGGNCQNVCRHVDNTSGYKGVHWPKLGGKWRAMIGVDGKKQHLGLFTTAEEAAYAYDAAARELHGDFATVNFPLPGERAA